MTEIELDPADAAEVDTFRRWLAVRQKLTKHQQAGPAVTLSPYCAGAEIDQKQLDADRDFFRTYAGAT